MQRIILVGALLILTLPAVAGIYKWTDGNGTVHYSDIPQSGAVPVEIGQNTSTLSAKVITHSDKQAPTSAATDIATPTQQGATQSYQTLTINQPQAEATVRDGLGQVTVTVNIMPPLQNGDQVAVLLDGKLAGQAASNSITLTNIDRGAHQLQAQVLNVDKKVLISSSAIIFYMQRPMVKR